ncbi:MAG: hypothetical protein CM15mP89_4000 [Gammaproteobacteria bacterium]|nr:MAG: hypothetical protein CM15mP89_4000 [Gammaproteobacteria bacterium]
MPGSDGALPDDPDEVTRIAREIGFPVIVKPPLVAVAAVCGLSIMRRSCCHRFR